MAELFRTIRHGIVRISKIDIVKNVEELSTELNPSLLGDPCCFEQTKIGVEESWPTQNVFAGITKGSDSVLDKHGSVEVLLDKLAVRTTSVKLGVTTEEVRPVSAHRA